MFQVDQLRSGYFGNLSKVGSVVGYLSVIVQCQSVFTAYLHSSRGDVSFSAR